MKRIPWHGYPFVSGLLVTVDPDRRRLADEAVRSFLRQPWPVKELVVVNATPAALATRHKLVREIQCEPGVALGDLKNKAIEAAQGEWCVFLSDDAWFSPHDYLSAHVAAARPEQISALIEMPVYFVNTGRFEPSVRHWALALVSFFRRVPWRFEPDGDVLKFIRKFPICRTFRGDSELILKFLHEPVHTRDDHQQA